MHVVEAHNARTAHLVAVVARKGTLGVAIESDGLVAVFSHVEHLVINVRHVCGHVFHFCRVAIYKEAHARNIVIVVGYVEVRVLARAVAVIPCARALYHIQVLAFGECGSLILATGSHGHVGRALGKDVACGHVRPRSPHAPASAGLRPSLGSALVGFLLGAVVKREVIEIRRHVGRNGVEILAQGRLAAHDHINHAVELVNRDVGILGSRPQLGQRLRQVVGCIGECLGVVDDALQCVCCAGGNAVVAHLSS